MGLKFFADRNLVFFQGLRFVLDRVLFKNSFFFLKRSMILCFLFFLFGLEANLISCEIVEAFEVSTHRQLTENAIEVMESSLDAYLIQNLGIEGGLNASFNGMTARQWMLEGSKTEDESFRPGRHFHDPISDKGIGGFASAIDWSVRPVGDQSPGGPWSWNDAREYYFKALSSPTKTEREEYWGKTFRALGQVMHLNQDMASPAHVRNDPHLSFFGFGDEDGIHDYMEKQSVGSYLGGGAIGPDMSMLQQSGAIQSEEPVSNLFDHNINTTGLNPEATLGGQAGLAEYANANFFSDDTIPGQNSLTPLYPSVAELIPATTIPFGLQYVTLPRLGSPSELKARAAKYTGSQAFKKFQLANSQLDLLNKLWLDDLVYEGQAINLIPRAVGYSAAVLDYFFRGNINVFQEKFILTGQILPERVCDPTPTQENGILQVDYEIPPNLGFEGTEDLYYERKDGTRVRIDEFTRISHAEVPSPVRWILVLDGALGPGAPEQRGIVAKTGLAEWEYVCLH